MSFKYLTNGSCPVCSGERRDCRNDGDLFFCRTENPNSGFRLIKEDTQGFGIYVVARGHSNYNFTRAKTKRVKQEDRVKVAAKYRDQAYRILSKQTILDAIHKNDLTRRGLSDAVIEKYLFRSFDKKQKVQMSGFFPSILNNQLRVREYGYSIPVFDKDGNIITYQLRIEDVQNKYLWASPVTISEGKKVSSHNDKLELPLQVINKETEVIGLCEGTLKPIVAAERHGISFIGASGGNFLSSELTLLETLEFFGNDKTYVLFPDAGFCIEDKRGRADVLEKNKKLGHWLVEKGYTVKFGYLNNALDKSEPDIDETDTYELRPIEQLLNAGGRMLSKLSHEELQYMAKMTEDGYIAMFEQQLAEIAPEEAAKRGVRLTWEQSLDTEVRYVPGQLPKEIPPHTVYIFNPDQRTKFYKEAKAKGHYRVLDISGCGTGKSFTAGNMKAEDFFPRKVTERGEESIANHKRNNKLVYLTQQPRNPATRTLELNFTELPSRHVGTYYEKGAMTEMGNYYRKRVDDVSKADELGNCHLAEMFVAIRDKRIHENLCGTCPFQKKCRSHVGSGWTEDNKQAPYGYEHQKIKVLNEASEIIASAAGFSYKLIGVNTYWAGIIDEYSQTLNPIEKVEVDIDKFSRTLSMMAHYDGVFTTKMHEIFRNVYPYLNGKETEIKYGDSHHRVLELFNEIPEDEKYQMINKAENINNERMESVRQYLRTGKKNQGVTSLQINSVETNWVTPFLEVWSGKVRGAFHLLQGKLVIYIRNQMMVDTLNSLRFAVFQDATGTRSHLSNYLDCRPQDILACKAVIKEEKNVEVIQITGMGNPNNYRTPNMESRVKALRKALAKRHPNMIGFMDYKKYTVDGDLDHLSTARGANAFKELLAACSIGIPCPSLSELQQQFTTYTRQKPEGKQFTNFVNNIRSGELIQEMGRLRAERRDEQLTYYVVSEDDISWLEGMGYKLTKVNATDLDPRCGDLGERVKWTIYKAAMETIKNGELSQYDDLVSSQVTINQVNKLAKFHELKEFYAEQYALIQQIVKEAKEAIDDRSIDDIINEVVAASDIDKRQEIQSVLEIYVPGFLQAYVKAEVELTDDDREVLDYVSAMKKTYQAEWNVLERYASRRQTKPLTNKLKKLPQVIQQLWAEQRL